MKYEIRVPQSKHLTGRTGAAVLVERSYWFYRRVFDLLCFITVIMLV